MLPACSAPVLSPTPAATHGEPLNPPLFIPASPAHHPSKSVATPSNHPPIRRLEHFNPTYPRALSQAPKPRQNAPALHLKSFLEKTLIAREAPSQLPPAPRRLA